MDFKTQEDAYYWLTYHVSKELIIGKVVLEDTPDAFYNSVLGVAFLIQALRHDFAQIKLPKRAKKLEDMVPSKRVTKLEKNEDDHSLKAMLKNTLFWPDWEQDTWVVPGFDLPSRPQNAQEDEVRFREPLL
jgi:hypothetical protein